MREVHDVHQAEDQRQADGDQPVEQPHQEAAGQTLDDGLGCHRHCPIAASSCERSGSIATEVAAMKRREATMKSMLLGVWVRCVRSDDAGCSSIAVPRH